jgi:p-hydroxybenzoate 3-monooxygenase
VNRTRTQVAIVGAGPAGLTLARLLQQHGIDSVVLEDRSREYVEARIRAGVLEQRTVDVLTESGAGGRLSREGIVHEGINLQFDGERHRLNLTELTGGMHIVVYGQTEIVKDLIGLRVGDGLPLLFEVDGVAVHDFEGDAPYVTFTHDGEEQRLDCDVIAGCDGFHGVCRPALEQVLTAFSREYTFGWLGILVDAPPSSDEVTYVHHERGFALLSLRSPTRSRLYLQCRPDEDLGEWPDARIWEELRARSELDGSPLNEGPILEVGVTGMRSFVVEPMQHGRLYLVGDAAHIVPPAGAKGLNLAIADAARLAAALDDWFTRGDDEGLDAYTARSLQRVWRAEHFSWWMTSMLHLMGDDPFDVRLQLSQLRYVTSSEHAARSLAENYVGLPI